MQLTLASLEAMLELSMGVLLDQLVPTEEDLRLTRALDLWSRAEEVTRWCQAGMETAGS